MGNLLALTGYSYEKSRRQCEHSCDRGLRHSSDLGSCEHSREMTLQQTKFMQLVQLLTKDQ